ncbi:MAG: SMC family ATPase, partial [Dehalococcoidia bacterium]
MIPLKLTLENFKCYRQGVPVLHLEGVHIACLCGANGHGKSSLLDAITWALWGDAVHRPQEELVHIGEQDMRVELEFAAGGSSPETGQRQKYRVIRRYARGRGTRAGATSLELQIAVGRGEAEVVGEGDVGAVHAVPQVPQVPQTPQEFRGISGNSVRETEAHIRRLVGMDYDTFVNSAFLVQGRADEFTTKRPAERQRVLANILGLGFYDRLQERARQKVRSCAAEIQRIQGQVQAWSEQLAQRPGFEEELPRVESELEQTGNDLAAVEREAVALRQQVESLRGRQQELEGLGRQRDTAREEVEQLRVQATQHEQRVRDWETVASREKDIVQAYEQFTKLRERDDGLNRLLEPYGRLHERRAPLVQRIEALPPLETALAGAERELTAVEGRENQLQTQRVELQDTEVKGQTLQAENQRLLQEMEALRSKVDMLSEGDARCPLCGTELGAGGREHIAAEYEAQGKLFAQQHRQNAATLRDLEPKQRDLALTVQKAEAELTESRRQLHGRIATLTQQVAEARNAPAELETLQRELGQLGYDPEVHQGVKESLGKLATAEDDHRLLRQATDGLPQERENL